MTPEDIISVLFLSWFCGGPIQADAKLEKYTNTTSLISQPINATETFPVEIREYIYWDTLVITTTMDW